MAGPKRALLEALRSGVGEMLPTLAWHKSMQDNEVLDEQIDERNVNRTLEPARSNYFGPYQESSTCERLRCNAVFNRTVDISQKCILKYSKYLE